MKIMIVDDESAILRGVSKIITDYKHYQFKIELATDAHQALKKLNDFKADLIITDIYMPIMNGLEFIEEVQKLHLCDKFIIITGHEDFSFAKKAIKFRVEEYIVKPINKRELMDSIIKIADALNVKNSSKHLIEFIGFENLVEKIELTSSTTKKIISYINQNYRNGIFLGKVSADLDMNENYLCSLLMKELGITFLQYLDYIRIKNAAVYLLDTHKSVSEISSLVGFSNERQMFNVFKKRVLMTPGQFKEKFQKVL